MKTKIVAYIVSALGFLSLSLPLSVNAANTVTGKYGDWEVEITSVIHNSSQECYATNYYASDSREIFKSGSLRKIEPNIANLTVLFSNKAAYPYPYVLIAPPDNDDYLSDRNFLKPWPHEFESIKAGDHKYSLFTAPDTFGFTDDYTNEVIGSLFFENESKNIEVVTSYPRFQKKKTRDLYSLNGAQKAIREAARLCKNTSFLEFLKTKQNTSSSSSSTALSNLDWSGSGKSKSYTERCEVSSQLIKQVQVQLKRLDLYPYNIDGLAGKGTLAGIKKAKKLVGADASKGECFTKADISAFTELADNKEQKSTNTCSSKNTKVCTDLYLCAFSTKSENDIRKWLKPNTSFYKSFINEANRRGLGCNVGQPYSEKLTAENVLSTRCSPENIEQCSDDTVCEKATLLRSGVRSWNFDAATYVDRAKDLSLDCKITIDNTPFSKEEAIYYLSQLVDFVSKNPTDFDLKFASEFNKVRSITEGAWSTELSKEFESFRVYIAKFPKFQQYLEELRLANEAAALKRVAQLREALNQDMEVLKEWAQLNVLDSKAAEIAMLDANLGDKSLQDVNKLEQLLAEAQRLVSATGLKDGPLKEVTKELVDNLYDPSSIYVFANTSGDAANLYKNLDGVFTFEQDKGSYCATNKIDAFDFILLRNSLSENFSGVTAFDQECSEASDIYVAKGNELTTERLFNLINLSDLTQVSQLSKADRDREYDQLMFLKETIQKDVLDGTRVGFGLLKSGDEASKLCAIIDDNEQGHQEQLKRNELLIKALGLQWNGFKKVTPNSEEAFKFIQRGECDAIYAGSLNLGRLYLAGEIADVSFEFIPVWVSKSSVEESQKAYEENMAASAQANAEAKKNLEDQAKLDEQAKKSLAESAAIRQRELREQNGLRFMVLRDELQEQVLAASNFGFENSSEESGYITKYLAQPFVDQTTRYSAFDTIIADMQKLKSERWEITEQRLDQIDFGEAKFKGRLVDALQVELKIASKNRLVGKYSEYCRSIVTIKDEDFEMWRNTTISDCSDEAALSKWKLENAFKSKWIVKQ